MTFNSLNDKMNYYSEISKKTGENTWNQDVIQNDFIEMISKCNLSLEQMNKLENYMVKNNATIDMQPSNNKSCDTFSKLVDMKKEEAKISKQKIA